MTALTLACKLLWLILTRQIRHDLPVVRGHGDWNEDGSSNYKRIYFADPKDVRIVPISKFDMDFDAAHEGSLTHQFYRNRRFGDGPIIEVLALD